MAVTSIKGLAQNNMAFQLKGGLFTMTIVQLLQADLAAITQQLVNVTQQTPHFFQNAPVILDLQHLAREVTCLDFHELKALLSQHGMIIAGVRGGNPIQTSQAIAANLAIITNKPVEQEPTKPVPIKSNATTAASKIVSHPVRSGQQIYAKNTDLVVLASVSPGAELLADGHIHVYGALRGRALAGINGDKNAHIFCRTLEAELVSIAGHYWISEDLKLVPPDQGTYIYLEGEHLRIGNF